MNEEETERLLAENRSLKLLVGCAIQASGGELRISEQVIQDSVFNEAIHRREDLETKDIVWTLSDWGRQ